MLSLRRIAEKFAADERGFVVTFVLILTPVLLALAAIAEFSMMHSMKAQLRYTADAAALAAVKKLAQGEGAVDAEAGRIAQLNMPAASNKQVAPPDNVDIGVYDKATRKFTKQAGGNAVRVITERSAANGNPVTLRFLSIFGLDDVELKARSTALASTTGSPVAPCDGYGLISRNQILISNALEVKTGGCIHADGELQTGPNLVTNSGTSVYGGRKLLFQGPANLKAGAKAGAPSLQYVNNQSQATGFAAAFVPGTQTAGAGLSPRTLVTQFQNGTRDLPYGLTKPYLVYNNNAMPPSFQAGKVYKANGSFYFGDNVTLENVGLIAQNEIRFGKNAKLKNVLIVAGTQIDFGDGSVFGGDFCNDGKSVLILTQNDFRTKAAWTINGAQILAGAQIELRTTADLVSVFALAEGDLKIYTSPRVTPCPGKMAAVIPPTGAGTGTPVATLLSLVD